VIAERLQVNQDIDAAWAAPCGVCCRLCEFFEAPMGLSCGGCLKERLCRVHEPECWFVTCAREHELEHCGLCKEFPCDALYANHQLCAGETPQIAVFRIGDLALRARMGTMDWLKAKLNDALPDAWSHPAAHQQAVPIERRRQRRNRGRWHVTLSFLPAAEAFGLSNVQTECIDASPLGIGLRLPSDLRDRFATLVRTKRNIEVIGCFPTSLDGYSFSGEMVWHNLDQTKSGEGVRMGIRLVSVSSEFTRS